uniref:NAC domain-containing protein n=1 Tax=Leersia perrieri TaxID=77586 RepID=A0A0D9VNG4_9ORYZ
MNNSYDMMGLRAIESRLPPGFRFHPSDEELVCYYLRNKQQSNLQTTTAATMLVEVDLHACEPWDLPEVAKLSADEWYFFSYRDKKYATGSRRNRATKQGYWKATGKDKAIHEHDAGSGGCSRKNRAVAGARKTLVFYFGRAPNGRKSSWVMHEFRLLLPHPKPKFHNMQEEVEDWVLCRVFHKGNNSNGGQACQSSSGVITATTTPRSSSSAPTTIHHLQLHACSLPQQKQLQILADDNNKLKGLEESLMISSSPATIIMSDQNRFSSSIMHHDHHDNQQRVLLDNERIIISSSSRCDDQLGSNEEQQQLLLDLSFLQAPAFLELDDHSPGGGGGVEIITDMENLLETSGVLQGADSYYMQLY